MKFRDVDVKAEFYDPISQETYRKTSSTKAVMVTDDGDGVRASEFEPDELVLEQKPEF